MNKLLSVICSLMLVCLTHLPTGYAQALEKSSQSALENPSQQLDIILAIDNSGSMKQNDPEFLTPYVVTDFLGGFGNKSRLGMIIFDQDARLAEPLTDVTGQLSRAKLLKSLEKIDYRGLYSDTASAVERAIYELKTNGRSDAQKLIILLTDGIVDTGDKQKDLVKEQWLKEALTADCKRSDIRIFGIAFTDKADFSLIQTLAVKTNGEYFRAFRAEDIQDIFLKINKIIFTPRTLSQQPAIGAPQEAPVGLREALPPQAHDSEASGPITSKVPTSPSERLDRAVQRSLFLPIILAGLFVLLSIILLILLFNRKPAARPRTDDAESSDFLQRGLPMPKAELIDVKNITTKKTFLLTERITKIGRDPNNFVAIPQDTVSSLHAVIEYKNGFFYLEDQRSKNKTRLNGKEIAAYSPTKLKNGDEITINVFKFIFILPDLIPAGETIMDFREASDTMISPDRISATPDTGPEDVTAIPQAILIDVENITGKKTFHLMKWKTKIGRGIYNEISIDQNSISGSHANIEYKDGSFYLEDQKSTNKTRINGEEIVPYSPRKLKSGDEIMFDIYKFIFLLERQLPSGDTGKRWPEE